MRARDTGQPEHVGSSAPILTIEALDAFHGTRQCLQAVSLEVGPQECVALVGQSGSGKTTLARAIIGLHRNYRGSIVYDGRPLVAAARERPIDQRRELQYIFQNPYQALNPRRTVEEALRVPLELFFPGDRRQRASRVTDALTRVSLSARTADQYPDQLSGGERQRVAIARALICQPKVLVCDEITSALDVSVQAAIVGLLRELQREQAMALLFVTHNLALVRSIADRVITLNDGAVVEEGPVDVLLDSPREPYTRQLIADTPSMPSGVSATAAPQGVAEQ